jgi:hypothetical protein
MKPIQKWIVIVVIAVVVVVVMQALGKRLGREAGKQAAITETSDKAQAAKMPDGLFGVRFLDDLSTLRRIRPGVARLPDGKWAELTEWQGIQVRAIYLFDEEERYLIMIVLNLQVQGDDHSFNKVQEILSTHYGPLSPPGQKEQYHLYARREAGGVALFHGLMQGTGGGMLHQVVFFKKK